MRIGRVTCNHLVSARVSGSRALRQTATLTTPTATV